MKMSKIYSVLVLLGFLSRPLNVQAVENDGKMHINNTINQTISGKETQAPESESDEQKNLFLQYNFDKADLADKDHKYLENNKKVVFKAPSSSSHKTPLLKTSKKLVFQTPTQKKVPVDTDDGNQNNNQKLFLIVSGVIILIIFSGLGYWLSKNRQSIVGRSKHG